MVRAKKERNERPPETVDVAAAQQNLDLAVIGNGRTAALVNPLARIVWWCFPRFDGDPVFCRLLAGDEEKGFTDVVLDGFVSAHSEYVRNTAIGHDGADRQDGAAVRITDFAPRFQQLRAHLPPAAADAHHRADRGPAAHHDPLPPDRPARPDANAARVRQQPHPLYRRRDRIRLTTDAPLSYVDREAPFVLSRPLQPGVRRRHAVRRRPRDHLPRIRRPHARLLARNGSAGSAISYEWQDAVIRAAITLKLSQLRGDRRDHRGAHDLDPRSARIGPHLGLPLLLAARRLFRGALAQPPRRDAHDGRLHLLHPHHRDRRTPATLQPVYSIVLDRSAGRAHRRPT